MPDRRHIPVRLTLGHVRPVVQLADGHIGQHVAQWSALFPAPPAAGQSVSMVRKQVYKITYPNGKIYVGMDLTGSLLYFGSPSASQQIAEDLDLDDHRFDLTLRKEILWESDTATDAEVRAMEAKLIRETGANNPAIGYNKLPRYRAP